MNSDQAAGTLGSWDSTAGRVFSVTGPPYVGRAVRHVTLRPMPGGRNENVVFTAVVSVIAAVAAVPIALVIALSGGGTTVVVAAIFALVPVGPLIGCYLWLDRYEPEPRSLLVTGLAWGAFVATLLALVLQGLGAARRLQRHAVAGVRRAGHRGGHQGALPAAAPALAPPRARRGARRHRLRRHGRDRVRVHREHPLPRRGLQRHRRDGPGRCRGAGPHLPDPLRGQPVRAPAVHRVHGRRGGHRDHQPLRLRTFPRPAARLCLRGRGARPLERLHAAGRRCRLLRGLPAGDGAGVHLAGGRSRSGPARAKPGSSRVRSTTRRSAG